MYIHVCTTGTTRSPIGKRLHLDAILAVGFGSVAVTRNGETLFDGERPPRKHRSGDGFARLRHAERIARQRGRGRYEVAFYAPLWSATYRRVARSTWVCVEAGDGFA